MTDTHHPHAGAYRVLIGLLAARTGQMLSPSRIWRVEMALRPLMARNGLADVDELVAALSRAGNRRLLDDVIDAMLNNETFFFREAAVFDDLAMAAIERVRVANAAHRRLTIWFCGCSTGQEVYSIAMLLAEQGGRWDGWTVRLIGTDVSNLAIARARAASYSQFEVQRGLAIKRLITWFDQVGDQWIARPALRTNIEFYVQNMLADRPPLPMPADVVFCRNLMLYFDRERRAAAFDRIASMIAPHGYLVLGAGETVLGQTSRFRASQDVRGAYEPSPDRASATPVRRAG